MRCAADVARGPAEPIRVETEVFYERTDDALDKIGKPHVHGVIYVIDAPRTIHFGLSAVSVPSWVFC